MYNGNPVATFLQTNNTTQDSNTYKNAIDGDISVLSTLGDMFAPHQAVTPAMSVVADAGALVVGGAVVAQNAQTGTVTANSSGNPRIDLAVINIFTAALSVIAGTPAGSPSPPACPSNSLPIAQIAVANGASSIVNANITDVRALSAIGVAASLGMTGEQNVSGSSNPETLSVGSVTAGDRIYACANASFSMAVGGNPELGISQASGSAAIALPAPTIQDMWGVTANKNTYMCVSGIVQVTGSGTLTLEVLLNIGNGGGTLNVYPQLYLEVFFLKKQ